MNAPLRERPAIDWPSPPLFRPSEPPPGGRTDCRLDLKDGRVMDGELVEFKRGATSIALRTALAPVVRRIDIAGVQSIKLTKPVIYIANVAALDAIGVTALRSENERPFTVTLQNGGKIAGETLGFVKERDGLFLFLVESKSPLVIKCFITSAQIKDMQIGPLLGEHLVGKHGLSADTLAQALSKQADLRLARIGSYFADRAIISAEELTRALQKQGKMPNARLGEILIDEGLITPDQLRQALTIQETHRDRRIGDILIEMGAVSVRLVQFALSDKLGIPYVNVREFAIGAGALESVDMDFAIRHQVLPLMRTAETLVVAVENPLAMDFLQDLRFQTDAVIDAVIADPQELKTRIAKEYSELALRMADDTSAVRGQVGLDGVGYLRNPRPGPAKAEDLAIQLARETQRSARPARDIEADARVSENTLVRLINKIIIEAHAQGASDIHVESNTGDTDTRIRFRKDGDLEDYLNLPQAYNRSLVSRIKIMAELDISEHRRPQDGKIDFAKHGPLCPSNCASPSSRRLTTWRTWC
jgi:hypothetical protein